jgi:hypothetical protein
MKNNTSKHTHPTSTLTKSSIIHLPVAHHNQHHYIDIIPEVRRRKCAVCADRNNTWRVLTIDLHNRWILNVAHSSCPACNLRKQSPTHRPTTQVEHQVLILLFINVLFLSAHTAHFRLLPSGMMSM